MVEPNMETLIKIIIVILAISFIIFLIRQRKYILKIDIDDDDMPHNLWFYSQLVNMEIGEIKPSYKNLLHLFKKFLYRRYMISKTDLKTNTIFEIVNRREYDKDVIDLYGEIWNNIDELKDKGSDEILVYTKSIKKRFNKGDFFEWIEERKKAEEEPCNNC